MKPIFNHSYLKLLTEYKLNLIIMKIKHYLTIFAFVLFAFSQTASGQFYLLYVGDAEDSSDIVLSNYLRGERYDITMISSSEFSGGSYETADAYKNYDALYISEIVGSSSVVPYKTAGYPIPCVTTEGYAVRVDRWDFISDNDAEFLQSGSTGRTEDIKTLVIDDGDHYITSEFGEGAEVEWTTALIDELGVTGFQLDVNVPEAIQLGHWKDELMEDFPCLWAIPAGSKVGSTGETIGSNIVFFGAIAPGLGSYQTDAFNTIIKRSFDWALDNMPEPEAVNTKKVDVIKVGPNPTEGIVNFSLSLKSNAEVQVNIYDITGKFIKTHNSGVLPAGNNSITFDVSELSQANYIYEIVAGEEVLRGIINRN